MLFQVQAIHAYKGEDEDELSFDAGEIIHVIEFDVPDEQVSKLTYHFNVSGKFYNFTHWIGVSSCKWYCIIILFHVCGHAK